MAQTPVVRLLDMTSFVAQSGQACKINQTIISREAEFINHGRNDGQFVGSHVGTGADRSHFAVKVNKHRKEFITPPVLRRSWPHGKPERTAATPFLSHGFERVIVQKNARRLPRVC